MSAPIFFDDAQVAVLRPAAGQLGSGHWREIARLSTAFGSARLRLGAGCLKLDGVLDPQGFSEAVAAAGLPLVACRVWASPRSARARELATHLAHELADAPTTLAVDSGDGQVAGARVVVHLGAAGGRVVVDGTEHAVASDDVALVHQASAAARGLDGDAQVGPLPRDLPIGWLPQDSGRVDLGARAVGDELPAAMAEMIGRMEVPTTLTPWRGVVFHDLAEGDADVVLRYLAPRGFVFDAGLS